ncbi:MAG TPA: DUF192 domain-containing protein [Burkholderiales bacterium]|nr:DUF192 domain-containing protein [Burkholderiales bacterium]
MSPLRTIARFSVALTAASAPALGQMPMLDLNAGIHLIRAEVANTFDSRARGLMFRKSLGANNGMLFVFTDLSAHCMWMRNTYVPLSVAFIDEQGTIVSVHDMQPLDETSHCAAKPARYALEMNRGWFAQKGIKPGAKIGGLDKAPPPR